MPLTKAELHSEIESQFPDNFMNLITAAILRPVMHDIVDYLPQDAITHPLDGGADNTANLQSIINGYSADGGGTLTLAGGQEFLISATVELPSNVSVNGNGATFRNDTNGSSFLDTTTFDGTTPLISDTVTVDPVVNSNKVTVSNGSQFTIGQRVSLMIGDDITDVTTPAVAFTAIIVDIIGNDLYIDRIFTYAVTVASGHQSAKVYPTYQHDFFIRDLHVDGNSRPSHGIDFYHATNITVEDIVGNKVVGSNMGFGLVAAFWCDNITVRHCTLYHNHNDEAAASHGRMFNFAGCRNVYVYDAECRDIHDQFAFVEGHSQNVNFYNCAIRHYNNPTGKSIFSVALSQIHVQDFYAELPNSYDLVSYSGFADPFTQAHFRNLKLRGAFPRVMPTFPDILGRIDWSDGTNAFIVDIDSAVTFETTIPLTVAAADYFIGDGLVCYMEIYISPDVPVGGIDSVFFGTIGADGSNNNNGGNVMSSLVYGSWARVDTNQTAGLFGSGGNSYGNFTRVTSRPKVKVNLTGGPVAGHITVRTKTAPFTYSSNTATPIVPRPYPNPS